MAHDAHQASGAMCGEESVSCAAGMPTFGELQLQGSPATKAPPSTSKGTGLQDKAAWALEVALDVDDGHSMAPGANILLVTTPNSETLGVQGFPQMMAAEQYVVDHHLANVISQSFASAEDAFGSSQSLLNLRHAFVSAAQSGVTVLGSSGDGGTANDEAAGEGGGALIPYPTVEWPASDPLVTGVGGTYLCTDAQASAGRVVDSIHPPAKCQANPGAAEVGWTSRAAASATSSTPPPTSDPAHRQHADRHQARRSRHRPAGQCGHGRARLPVAATRRHGGLFCGSTPCSTGWYDIGGTSLSCPQWAGLVAIADQINGGGLGLINPGLYRIGANPARYAADFYDVTLGNNTADPSVAGYPATTGWDPVTGLGTPNAGVLLPDLVQAVHGN